MSFPGLGRGPWTTVRVGWVGLPVLAVFLSGCRSADAAPFTGEMFNQHDIVIGSGKHQTVLAGFFRGGAFAELAVVSIDENEDRRLRLYAFREGTWAPVLDEALLGEVLFVDVARVGGRDRLVTYEQGRLSWFDPESASQRLLVAVSSNYNPPPTGMIPHVDVTRDVNADGRDDLVVPDVNGFWVVVQMSDGAFAEPVKIGPSFEVNRIHEAEGYRYSPWDQGRIHEVDHDRDGRVDLVFWNEDHFEVHLQDERGQFAPAAETFTTTVAFDSDDLASLAAPHGVRRRRKDNLVAGAMTGKVLHSLTDKNGDGVADLVVFSLEGGSTVFGQTSELWSMHANYEVHFGAPAPDGGTVFAPEVGAAIQVDGIPFGMGAHDFDHDRQVDMMFTIIDPGIFKVIGMLASAMLTDSVSVDLEFYRMDGGVYPDRPDANRKIKTTSIGRSGERTVYPAVLIGDVNGDRRADLLVGSGTRELHVYHGAAGPGLFAPRPQTFMVAMPHEDYIWLVDLNNDGKQDILMHYASTTEPQRVTMLITR